jgi:hypothetical protein
MHPLTLCTVCSRHASANLRRQAQAVVGLAAIQRQTGKHTAGVIAAAAGAEAAAVACRPRRSTAVAVLADGQAATRRWGNGRGRGTSRAACCWASRCRCRRRRCRGTGCRRCSRRPRSSSRSASDRLVNSRVNGRLSATLGRASRWASDCRGRLARSHVDGRVDGCDRVAGRSRGGCARWDAC